MRILTCAGYYGSGSSAVTDLLSEFSDCVSLGDYEFRFVQDPDGVRDLEYNLVENYHRHNSGHALKKYRRLVDFWAGGKFVKKYEKRFFHGKFKELSYKYIDDLTDYKYTGYWHEDLRDRGKCFYFRKKLAGKIAGKTIYRGTERGINMLPKEVTLGSRPGEEKFLALTQKYITDLFSVVNPENKGNVIVDQLFPPENLARYVRYVPDVRVFVVDRDPRDIFILEKKIWRGKLIPKDVETFCKWYETTRAHRETEELNTDKTIFVQFEDLISKYEETAEKLIAFAGLDKNGWAKQKQILVPEKSINNTRLWLKYPEFAGDIAYIENHLTEYLYNW